VFRLIQDCRIQLEDCILEYFQGNCIKLQNPKILELDNWAISKNNSSGVIVEISKSPESENKCRLINIYNCYIHGNKGSGVEIYATEFIDQNLKIFLTTNRILNNHQSGLYLARMAINALKISDWKFASNSGKGWWIKIVHQSSNLSNFLIKDSKFNSNKDIGLQIDDSGFRIHKVQCNANGRNGISLNGTLKPATLPEEVQEFLK